MKLGLTGGIGCGKSTVVGLFKELGWITVQSDALVRDLLAEDPEVREAVLGRWGDAVRGADGQLDRKRIAGIVFKDAEELKWLEGLVHPRVRGAWEAALKKAENADILVEIPLLFEKRLETAFDLTVCVSSPPEVVSERMVARGYSEEDVEQRRLLQLPLLEKCQRADYVISNAGSLEFLKEQVSRLNEFIHK